MTKCMKVAHSTAIVVGSVIGLLWKPLFIVLTIVAIRCMINDCL